MSNPSEIFDTTIVGGGFAGLSAALRLLRAGQNIQVVEKRAFFGGRAYSFKEPTTGETVDNGQHLLMGCYHETMRFLRDLGTLDKLAVQPQLSATFAEDGGRFHTLRCPDLKEPWHLGVGLWRYRGLKFKDKWRMTRLMRRLRKAQPQDLDDLSVRQFLEKHRQTPDAVEKFWEPLALGTLNESMDNASAKLFVEVLRRSLLSTKRDASLALASVGLSELYAKPAQAQFEKSGVPLHFNRQIRRIQKVDGGFELFTNQDEVLHSSQVLLALPPQSLQKLLKDSGEPFASLYPELSRFHSSPIVSINLWIDGFNPKENFVGLLHSPLHWLFNKPRILKDERAGHVTLVVSGAQVLAAQNRDELVALAWRELKRFYPELEEAKLIHSQVVKEMDATFSARTGLEKYRPDETTAIPGLFLAGDWLNTGLPATIESAVTSGHKAAEAILLDSPPTHQEKAAFPDFTPTRTLESHDQDPAHRLLRRR